MRRTCANCSSLTFLRVGYFLLSRPARTCKPASVVDPTGVGDAFRGGFMKGLAIGCDYEVCGRMGSVAAAYALEHMGGSSHTYTRGEFRARYAQHFGPITL